MRRYSYYGYGRRRSWGRWLLYGAIALALLLPLAEFGAGRWLAAQQPERQKAVSLQQAYQLRWQDGENPKGEGLAVRPHPLLGYELLPQKSDRWQVDGQGFRLAADLPETKPAGEIRIFVLGNSTAFGSLAANDAQTVGAQLEALCQERLQLQKTQPTRFKPEILPFYADQIEAMAALPPRIREGRYRVISAGVPGYTSGNELALLVHRVLDFDPDAVVLLDGYEDLRLPETQAAAAPPTKAAIAPGLAYRQHLQQQFQNWWQSWHLVQWLRGDWQTAAHVENTFSSDRLAATPAALTARVQRYHRNLRQVARVLRGIPTLVVLQPEITGKSKPAPSEQAIRQRLDANYPARVRAGYEALNRRTGDFGHLRFSNLYAAFGDTPEAMFVDPIHLTAAGHRRLAERLYRLLEPIFAVTPRPHS
ncbi:MAG: SGNH/GDSL hydrolase family protein [Pseudanabaenaceae cyanobacterium]